MSSRIPAIAIVNYLFSGLAVHLPDLGLGLPAVRQEIYPAVRRLVGEARDEAARQSALAELLGEAASGGERRVKKTKVQVTAAQDRQIRDFMTEHAEAYYIVLNAALLCVCAEPTASTWSRREIVVPDWLAEVVGPGPIRLDSASLADPPPATDGEPAADAEEAEAWEHARAALGTIGVLARSGYSEERIAEVLSAGGRYRVSAGMVSRLLAAAAAARVAGDYAA